MAGLVLKLAPHERVLINGAVIENGDKRSRLSVVSPKANILRLRDAIAPDQATTPVRRVCYIAQLLLTGDCDRAEGRRQLLHGIEQLSQALVDPDSRRQLADATAASITEDYYRALRRLRALLPREERLLTPAAEA
ncbi:flagellar biosynthesis repressor FlbT [Ketogulonicigenium vulgare]|uniref:Flagellin synthesis repressor protein FlbT, putative n=1 Tax=Ketogulonicigenium vulgare (strain WSH-001) TaxID=759362 RepID=F9Y4F3_KETVW|nr:flagellar biosynthesis repressor FlbT [Ketogulonicigenium vulgare]ADO43487.1 flagellin synthesis repressor protein FlbT, putative [Ketogulonicigenium vulgare Y25]AEM41766.1 Flagellin synthesis repressor protein FlbT, putative [Ketogulonicigenium vulgare WSH-001]ALJ81872.1 flagellar biosynthesis repressor FlbT [Ketogulonicigenium vulgare]ANW34523.1 flagellar biosynthesis repressor FlbT [Ketogulonicigenium vulgare]AOZ55522.1 flagellin synthesis repressor protein FlbT [Ketogulonicigenium vulga